MVAYDGEKMSKSLGNLVFVSDLLKVADPRAIRLALLRHHYRAGFEWFDTDLDEGQALLRRLMAAADCAADPPSRRRRPPARSPSGSGPPSTTTSTSPGPSTPSTTWPAPSSPGASTRRRPGVLLELAGLVGVDLTWRPAPGETAPVRLPSWSLAVLAASGRWRRCGPRRRGADGRP